MIDDLPYKGKPSLIKCAAPVTLPALDLDKVTDPAGYLPDDGLVDAVNVALMLRQPLHQQLGKKPAGRIPATLHLLQHPVSGRKPARRDRSHSRGGNNG